MKVLVTGGAGFIGSHVVKNCLELGFETIVLDDLSGGFTDNVPLEATFIKGSILDQKLINTLFMEHKFDYVYHLAAYAAEGLSHFIRNFNYQNNLIGSINLINASINTSTIKRFVYTSSIAVYGAGQLPMTEDMEPEPEDPYGVSKYAVELDLKAAYKMFGLNYTIFRPHNVYGENQNMGDRYRNVIGIFMNQLMQDQPMTIFGDGSQTRAFSHIDDVAPIIAGCVNNEKSLNQIFNVGANKPYTVKCLAEIVAKSMGIEPNIQYLPARNEVVHAFSDHLKVENVFEKNKYIGLVDGISQMAEWAKKHGPRKSNVFSNIEVTKNLPQSWTEVISK